MTIDKDRVREVVRQVVDEALGRPLPAATETVRHGWRRFDEERNFKGRELITEQDVIAAQREGRALVCPATAMFTPAARDAVERYRIKIVEPESNDPSVLAMRAAAEKALLPKAPEKAAPAAASAAPKDAAKAAPDTVRPILPVTNEPGTCAKGAVAIACDHGGLEMKKLLVAFLENEAKIPCRDLGTHTTDAVDYPDYAKAVADLVAKGECCRGIVIDGAGIGSSMAANKVRGVRAAHCSNVVEARNSREHNDANVLSLGGRIIGIEMAKAIAIVFLKTDFLGGRHEARVKKIMNIEKA